MRKPYDATAEFAPFDRSQAAPVEHPNKRRARVLKRARLAQAKLDSYAGK